MVTNAPAALQTATSKWLRQLRSSVYSVQNGDFLRSRFGFMHPLFEIIFLLLMMGLGVPAYTYLFRNASFKMLPLADLMADLKPVSRALILIAQEYLDPLAGRSADRTRPSLGWKEMMELLGGMAGVRTIRRNAILLVDMAFHAARWNSVEAKNVVEQLALQRRELETWARHLEFWRFVATPIDKRTFYVQRIAAIYYLMTQQLLALYEVSHAGLVSKLEQALFEPELA